MKVITGEFPRTALGATEGTDAVGGRLSLTNVRLVFTAHAMNRIAGQLSIFLPTIRAVSDSSRMLSKQITVHCAAWDAAFVVWNRHALMSEIDAARNAFGPDQIPRVVAQLEARPELLGEGITRGKMADAMIIAGGLEGDLAEFGTGTDRAAWTTLSSFLVLASAAAEIREEQFRKRNGSEDDRA